MRACLAFLLAVFALIQAAPARAQSTVVAHDSLKQHIFVFSEIEMLVDTSNQLSFEQVSAEPYRRQFQASRLSTPQALRLNTHHWFRIRIAANSEVQKRFLLEFFDQTIDEIVAYIPGEGGAYREVRTGDQYPFQERYFRHKNFELPIGLAADSVQTYYFRVKSSQIADAIIVLRSVDFFVRYALTEYISFGIFYGMIFVFAFYNLILFASVRRKQYLYYVLYLVSVAFFEMCSDGIAYQYLWPDAPRWNQISFAFFQLSASISLLLFTRALFQIRDRVRWLDRLLTGTIVLRLLFFAFSLVFDRSLLNYKFIEFIPLSLAFFAGLNIYVKGYKEARFFIIGYGFILLGFTFKVLIMLGIPQLNFGVVSYYSLSLAFILEMIFFSLAIGDNLSMARRKQESMQQEVIRQMTENAGLKDILNRELRSEVRQRNAELEKANQLLKEQAEKISQMNLLLQHDKEELEQDKQALITDVRRISRDRALSAEVDFEEFSAAYPDAGSCYEFLSELKWKEGYQCRRCANQQYAGGKTPFSRRCSKCGYDESVTSYTLYHNTRLPINVAFYMTFLVFSTKGKISSHRLSHLVGIRQSTCWNFMSRIKKAMAERKQSDEKQGWSQLVLDFS
jgi:hypothetical protein